MQNSVLYYLKSFLHWEKAVQYSSAIRHSFNFTFAQKRTPDPRLAVRMSHMLQLLAANQKSAHL